MLSNMNTGACILQGFEFEYQISRLEFTRNKSLNIEAVCYSPSHPDKEPIFKHQTKNFIIKDDRFTISMIIISSFIDKLDLPNGTLHKLSVINGKIYYIVL